MLATIVLVSLAFYWLAVETDYFRVNLALIPEVVERKSWSELEPAAQRIPDKLKPFWLKHPENMQPLCGLDWLTTTQHVIPTYKFEIKAWNVTHKVNLKSADCRVLRELAVTMLKPNREERRELVTQRKLARVNA